MVLATIALAKANLLLDKNFIASPKALAKLPAALLNKPGFLSVAWPSLGAVFSASVLPTPMLLLIAPFPMLEPSVR